MEKTTEKNQSENQTEYDRVEKMINEAMDEAEKIATSKTDSTQKQIENPVSIVHKGFKNDDVRQQMVNYAYKLGGMDFVTMIECENGKRDLKIKGDGGHALGLCQMNDRWHKVPEGYTTDWRVAVEYCYQKWSAGTKFYGPSRIIKGQKCSSYVKDRFQFI